MRCKYRASRDPIMSYKNLKSSIKFIQLLALIKNED